MNCKQLVDLMIDCGFEMEDFELLAKHSTGPLKEEAEKHLFKLDEIAEEERQMDASDRADAAYDWHMECKGDQMREDNEAYRLGIE